MCENGKLFLYYWIERNYSLVLKIKFLLKKKILFNLLFKILGDVIVFLDWWWMDVFLLLDKLVVGVVCVCKSWWCLFFDSIGVGGLFFGGFGMG